MHDEHIVDVMSIHVYFLIMPIGRSTMILLKNVINIVITKC